MLKATLSNTKMLLMTTATHVFLPWFRRPLTKSAINTNRGPFWIRTTIFKTEPPTSRVTPTPKRAQAAGQAASNNALHKGRSSLLQSGVERCGFITGRSYFVRLFFEISDVTAGIGCCSTYFLEGTLLKSRANSQS